LAGSFLHPNSPWARENNNNTAAVKLALADTERFLKIS
jgi:hypothetical protein